MAISTTVHEFLLSIINVTGIPIINTIYSTSIPGRSILKYSSLRFATIQPIIDNLANTLKALALTNNKSNVFLDPKNNLDNESTMTSEATEAYIIRIINFCPPKIIIHRQIARLVPL